MMEVNKADLLTEMSHSTTRPKKEMQVHNTPKHTLTKMSRNPPAAAAWLCHWSRTVAGIRNHVLPPPAPSFATQLVLVLWPEGDPHLHSSGSGPRGVLLRLGCCSHPMTTVTGPDTLRAVFQTRSSHAPFRGWRSSGLLPGSLNQPLTQRLVGLGSHGAAVTSSSMGSLLGLQRGTPPTLELRPPGQQSI